MGNITGDEYKSLQDYIYNTLGIEVDDSKKETVAAKIDKLARRNGMNEMGEYIDYILQTSDSGAIQEFINDITTNTTEFFREPVHFDYIKHNIGSIIGDIPRIKSDREICLWSAACSSGEEPVTLAIVLKECLPRDTDISVKILATDISEKILRKAVKGIYTETECKGMPKEYIYKYFRKLPDGSFQVNEEIKKCVTYRLFNLMNGFKFQKGFDIVFCRNVMIYLNSAVQQKLINKFYDVIVPNGLFFTGHSESMINKEHKFRYIQNALYKK